MYNKILAHAFFVVDVLNGNFFGKIFCFVVYDLPFTIAHLLFIQVEFYLPVWVGFILYFIRPGHGVKIANGYFCSTGLNRKTFISIKKAQVVFAVGCAVCI